MADTVENSKRQSNSLNFLWEISSVLAMTSDSKLLIDSLKDIFNNYLGVENFRIIVRDENTLVLKDFVKSWIVIEKNKQQELVENIFEKFEKAKEASIILNNILVYYTSKTTDKFVKNLSHNENILYSPIFNEKKLIGVIEVNFSEIYNKLLETDFASVLKIAFSQISSAIVNKILNRNLCNHIKFQNVMKSIAKLIETQFDLDYILPIIGELIDSFISEHLIYIFVKDDEDFKLFWPLDCQDTNILKLLKKVSDNKACIISKDGKTGLFTIRNDEQVIGVIAASSNIDKLSKSDVDYLSQLSVQASITTQRANSYAQVLRYATIDALTGLNNRRQFEMRLKQEVANARRNNKPLCCIMLDIDYFKHVNDTWGHSAGDYVLKNVAKIIANELREYDIASRYGGEEFCILLPDTKIKEAIFVAQRLRAAVEKTEINISEDQVLGNDMLNVTISIGVSEFNDTVDTPDKLYQNADIALYEAKRRGRNRVIVYDSNLE